MKQIYIILCLAPVLFMAGCNSRTIIDEYRATSTVSLHSNDSIVILGRRHSGDYETEHDFVECVGKSLASGNDSMNVIPEKQFVDSMYPYFETSTAPMDVKNLDKLVKNPNIAKKLDDFRLRYFIWIDGSTETTDKAGSISCAIGPGGGGCFGFATWDDEANYEASIWDFKEAALSGKISAETKGSSFMPAIIIPIPMLARVQSNACKTLANQIKTFFAQQS